MCSIYEFALERERLVEEIKELKEENAKLKEEIIQLNNIVKFGKKELNDLCKSYGTELSKDTYSITYFRIELQGILEKMATKNKECIEEVNELKEKISSQKQELAFVRKEDSNLVTERNELFSKINNIAMSCGIIVYPNKFDISDGADNIEEHIKMLQERLRIKGNEVVDLNTRLKKESNINKNLIHDNEVYKLRLNELDEENKKLEDDNNYHIKRGLEIFSDLIKMCGKHAINKVPSAELNTEGCIMSIDKHIHSLNASLLRAEGLNVITLSKTIDNDLWGADMTDKVEHIVKDHIGLFSCDLNNNLDIIHDSFHEANPSMESEESLKKRVVKEILQNAEEMLLGNNK